MSLSRTTGRLVPAALLLAAVLLGGCFGDDGRTGPDEEPRLTRVEVSPDSVELNAIGATQQYSASGFDQFGEVMAGVEFEWSTDAPSVVDVDSTGLATARDSGRAQVQATARGIGGAGLAKVRITRDEPAAVEAVSGSGQHGTTLHPYPDSLVVRLEKADGDPATGVVVDFEVVSGTGSVSPSSDVTGVDGTARTQVHAGATTGPVTVEARADTVGPATFQVTTTVLYVEIVDFAFVDPRGRTNTAASAQLQLGRDTVLFEYTGGTTQHTVTSGEGQGGDQGDGIPAGAEQTLDSGLLDPGDSFAFVPESEGTWTYFCEVHPELMYGAELVVQAP